MAAYSGDMGEQCERLLVKKTVTYPVVYIDPQDVLDSDQQRVFQAKKKLLDSVFMGKNDEEMLTVLLAPSASIDFQKDAIRPCVDMVLEGDAEEEGEEIRAQINLCFTHVKAQILAINDAEEDFPHNKDVCKRMLLQEGLKLQTLEGKLLCGSFPDHA